MRNNLKHGKYAFGAVAVAVAAGSADAAVISTIDNFTVAFDTGTSPGFAYGDRRSANQAGLTLPSGFTERNAQVGGTGSRLYSSGGGSVSGSVASGSGGFAQLFYEVQWYIGQPAVNLASAPGLSINVSNLSGGTLKFTMIAYSYSGPSSSCVVDNVGSNGVIAFNKASFVADPMFGAATWSTITSLVLKIENTGSGVAQFGLSSFSVPAPGAVALLGAAGLAGRRRRA